MSLITDPNLMYTDQPLYLTISEVKLTCPEKRINPLVNLPPVFRHYEIINEPDVIDRYMKDYMVSNKIRTAYSIFAVSSCCPHHTLYDCYSEGLIITDIKSVIMYTIHNAFSAFVLNHVQKYIDVLGSHTIGLLIYKINMNGTLRYDGIRTKCSPQLSVTTIIIDTRFENESGSSSLNQSSSTATHQSKNQRLPWITPSTGI